MYKPKIERGRHDGIQKIYSFDNGYGASVIKHSFSYGGNVGLWELAVIKFANKDNYTDYKIDYVTPITNDVIGFLNEKEVEKKLKEIKNLKI